MTHDDVQAWLDRYVGAWQTYDPEAIGNLFSEDVEYRYHPQDDPVRGRAEIVTAWVSPDGDASARRAWVVEGALPPVRGRGGACGGHRQQRVPGHECDSGSDLPQLLPARV